MTRSMTPERAVERYLKERKPEVSESTYQNHKYALTRFVEWTDAVDVDDISTLDGFHVHDFKIHRRENGGVSEMTLKNNMCTLRVFIRWLESMDVVDPGLADRILIPTPDNDTRDTKIEPDTAEGILEYLDTFEYGTLRHFLFALIAQSEGLSNNPSFCRKFLSE